MGKNGIDIDTLLNKIDSDISNLTSDDRTIIAEKFILAALGCIPWIGGFISADAIFKFEDSDRKIDGLKLQWLREHAVKIEQLSNTLSDVINRFENFGSEVDERIQSTEYLSIVRKAFTVWDHADTEEKRKYVGNLVSNAAGTNLCSDDIIRLFIDWLDLYHEFHFLVIKEIYQGMNISRHDIWSNLRGEIPREDSADADLFPWVPASVHHHIAGNNSQFIYGGVRVMPRVNVITSSSPRFNQTINNAFNVSGRATVGSSVIFSSNANIGPRTVNSSARIPATTSSARNYQSSTANAMPNRTSAASNSTSGSFTKTSAYGNSEKSVNSMGSGCAYIFRGTESKPEAVFNQGFNRNGNLNIRSHIETNEKSGFISTSKSPNEGVTSSYPQAIMYML